MARGHTIQISVLADTKKFSNAMRNLSRETGISRLGDAFRNAGRRVVDFFKSGVKWAGAFTGALAGMSIAGGLKRALAVEDATLLMQQLGMSVEEIDRAIESVDRTFDGTPFANPDGFNFSAQLRTSGKSLDQIERDLRNVSNVTAMTLDKDFGRISELFLKMAANGRVTATDLNSIGLAGYPIRQVLGDALGVTTEELNAMVSAGDLSYDMLQELLGGVENLDGAAQNLGDSTRVSWSNMLTAFSTVGEKFVTSLLPVFRGGFQDIRNWVRDLREPAERLGQTIATWLEDKAIPAVQNLAAWFKTDLAPALRAVWDLVSGAFATAWDTIATALDEAGLSARGTGDSLKSGVISALETLGPILAGIITAVGDLVAWFIRNRDTIATLAVAIGSMVAAWAAFNKTMAIVRAVTTAVNVVMAANPIGLVVLAIVGLVAAFVTLWNRSEAFRNFWIGLWEGIKTAANAVVDWFKSIPAWFSEQFAKLQSTVNTFSAIWSKAWQLVRNLASTAWNAIRSLIAAGVDRVRAILHGIGVFIGSFLRSPISTMRGLFNSAGNALRNIASNMWNRIKSAFTSGISNAVASVKALPGRVISAFGNPGALLANVGRRIIDGFINGIMGGFQRVRNTLSNLTNLLPSWKGPAEKDRKLLTGPADLIMDGLINQFQDRFRDVRDTMGDLTGIIGGTDLGDLDAPGIKPGALADQYRAAAGRGAAGPPAGNQYHITVQALVPTADTGRYVVQAIRDFERINGARA